MGNLETTFHTTSAEDELIRECFAMRMVDGSRDDWAEIGYPGWQLISRIILSDGQYFIQAMLATQLNDMVTEKQVDKNVVIKLVEYVTNAVQQRK